jgi:hypothetical protein
MRIECSWCLAQGLDGYLGDREPYDNDSVTHGICKRHKGEVLAEAREAMIKLRKQGLV